MLKKLFSKKDKSEKVKKKAEEELEDIKKDEEDNVDKNVLKRGQRTVKDLIAPSCFDRSNPDYLRVENKYVRSFTLNGYPPSVSVGWLDDLYNYDGDMDTALYIEPADTRAALEEITSKITKYETQLYIERASGKITNITALENTVRQLYTQRAKIERDEENLFYVQLYSNLYADSEDELNKRDDMLMNRLKGKRINLMPSYLQQDDNYKNALPFSKVYTNDRYRSLNTGAVTACFPFYNSEISHDNGVFLGVNMDTATPVIIDFYDRSLMNNSNFTVFGTSGSGKTYFVSILTIRSTLKGIRTVIIDPESEYTVITKELGGSYVSISPNSETKINPFDLEEEMETDDYGNPTGEKAVRIKDKVSDVLNLIGVMNGGLTREQESLTSLIISEVYERHGFTDDPKSLYVTEDYFDERTGVYYHHGDKKPMPTFSDFHDLLTEKARTENNKELIRLSNSLRMFKRDGVYGMFDCQTSADIDFANSPVVTFDISELEEGTLRPIGMYIALSWTWEKFIKKNPEQQKRIVCDEAWMLVNKNMSGYQYTANFLDKASRRIRKRNGGLTVASQNFTEFENSEQGKAVLTNASLNVFLKQSSTDIDAVQDVFKLSDGEKNFLYAAGRGEALLKMGEESSRMYVLSFPHEHKLIKGIAD